MIGDFKNLLLLVALKYNDRSMETKVISFSARGSGSGKTKVIELLISEFNSRGFKVAAVKHSFHMPDFDKPGKDTYRYRESGADKIMLFSRNGLLMYDRIEKTAYEIKELAEKDVDIVLMEGFKDGPFSKIEVYSSSVHPVPLSKEFPGKFSAIVTDTVTDIDIPSFRLSDIKLLADFIISHLSIAAKGTGKAS